MPKNPFVASKSRKKKKSKKIVQKFNENTIVPNKPFCPRNMVRYDDVPGYDVMWTCKICLRCLLSENAVYEHLAECKKSTYELNSDTHPKVNFNDGEVRQYICKYCDQVFSRMVTLTKHEEQHEISASSPDGESDSDKFLLNIKTSNN
ncbi:uncharacterized protein LOC126901273 isoform X2 [Daktulosphaira vitifoliae]|nr:uncharacterized protein LOC126901273 isoform X2 [Daktulosphaira vitifoliae]